MKNISMLCMALLMSFSMMAQQRSVSGSVTDSNDKSAMIGVSIMEKGTTNGTITDIDGNFSLNVTTENPILVFSSIGYKTQEINIGDQTHLTVLMNQDTEQLDELVVVGYGSMRKSDLTGSLSSLKSDQLTKLSAVDVTQAIQGRAPGVSVVNNSGEPGAGTKIRIRGTGSVNNSDPLFVVDGFPVNDISHIAPQDIESMEILKDASAVAIYGSRGANGVILVKTKSGAFDKKTQINVNVFAGTTQATKQLQMLNASEFATLKLESYANANLTPSQTMQSILDYAIQNNSVGTNWQDEIMRTGTTQNYNLNVSGGSERNKYDIGGTYSKEEGIIKNTYLDKFMFHLNNEYKLYDNVHIGINASYTTYQKSGNNGDFYSGSLTSALKADPVSAAWDSYTDQFGEIYFSYGTNPALSAYENQFRKTSEDRFIANAYLQIDDILFKGLSFRAQFGQHFAYGLSKNYSPQYYITADQQRNRSELTENRSQNIYWNTNEYFSYVNTFGKHSINATLGMEAQKSKSNNIFGKVYDVPQNADLRYLSMSPNKENLEVSGSGDHNALLSGFFRMNYSFDGRYLFTGTYRADGTSKFKKKWGYFPSFSAGWNMLEEAFMEDLKSNSPLSQLKLRAGWGHVGNQASAGNFDYLTLMTNGYTAVFGGSQVDGVIQEKLANEELSWETSEQYNIGLDYSLFNGGLSGNIDYFIRNTNDMILDTPIPIYAGKARPKTNAGSVQNKGVEFSINYDTTLGKDFYLNAAFNISAIKNKVTSLGGGEPLYGTYSKTEEGREIASFFGLQTAGIFKTEEQLKAHTYINAGGNEMPIQPDAKLGDVIFVDQNNDGKIDDNDRIHLGSPNPDFTYGFSLSAAYKGFDFNAFIQGSQGNEIANYMYSVLYSSHMREWSNSKDMMNRWTPDNPNSDLPRVNQNDKNENDRFSDRYIEDGSYLRLKTLQLGYTLPSHLSRKIHLSKARIYVSADNLLTFTKYSGYNPEMGDLWSSPLNAGVDMASYPTPRVFTVGLNLSF
ncbi:MAG TPA: TonB-dependent receptor [Porphyromonadaceae bacterium]|nr:TonB-dependent receptor [Porphyromonadaceae bacterium]